MFPEFPCIFSIIAEFSFNLEMQSLLACDFFNSFKNSILWRWNGWSMALEFWAFSNEIYFWLIFFKKMNPFIIYNFHIKCIHFQCALEGFDKSYAWVSLSQSRGRQFLSTPKFSFHLFTVIPLLLDPGNHWSTFYHYRWVDSFLNFRELDCTVYSRKLLLQSLLFKFINTIEFISSSFPFIAE